MGMSPTYRKAFTHPGVFTKTASKPFLASARSYQTNSKCHLPCLIAQHELGPPRSPVRGVAAPPGGRFFILGWPGDEKTPAAWLQRGLRAAVQGLQSAVASSGSAGSERAARSFFDRGWMSRRTSEVSWPLSSVPCSMSTVRRPPSCRRPNSSSSGWCPGSGAAWGARP